MALIKSSTQREIETLVQLEKQLERREKRERVCHFIIGGLAFLAMASYVAGHLVGGHRSRRR